MSRTGRRQPFSSRFPSPSPALTPRRALAFLAGAVLVAAAALVPGGNAQAATSNLVPNPSVERSAGSRPASWSPIATGSSARSMRYLANGAAAGHRFVRTMVTAYRSGSAGWTTASVAVKSRATYTYTVWTRSNATALVQARVVDTHGRVTYQSLGRVTPSDAWKATTFTLTTKAGTARLAIRHLLVSVGTLDVDNARLARDAGVASAPPTNPPTPNPPPSDPQPTDPPASTPPATTPPSTVPRSSGGIVSVTFDDGLRTQYDNALPVLRANGIPGTFYVVSGLIGISTTMSIGQLHDVQGAGHELGSHTVTHRDLTTLSGADLTAELANSKAALEAQFGTIRSLAYPYGATNDAVAAAAARYYSSARTTDGGQNSRGAFDRYRLRMRYVTSGTTASDVASWMQQAAAANAWVILVYHGIDSSGDVYTTTPSTFAAQMAAVRASGVRPLTVSAALSAMT